MSKAKEQVSILRSLAYELAGRIHNLEASKIIEHPKVNAGPQHTADMLLTALFEAYSLGMREVLQICSDVADGGK